MGHDTIVSLLADRNAKISPNLTGHMYLSFCNFVFQFKFENQLLLVQMSENSVENVSTLVSES